jgi:carboxyl-terminal processing protease
MQDEKKPFYRGIAGIFLLGLITLTSVFYAGYRTGFTQNVRALEVESAIEGVAPNAIDWTLFGRVWQLLESKYLRGEVDEQTLLYGAIEGLVDALEDPYTTYFDPELARSFEQEIEGTFSGIGAEIGLRDDFVVIISPINNSPAAEAGVQSGDIILAVDGEDATNWSVFQAVEHIRGERGTDVTLTIFRESEGSPRDIVITRDEITLNSVEWEILDDNIGLIEVHMFNGDTTRLFEEARQAFEAASVESIILDMRNNPGGLLSEAVSIAGYWLDGQVVVRERGKVGESTKISRKGAPFGDMKTVVLVNGGSASASEIVAGALQDYGKAHIIGTTTFGKGSVQEFQYFQDGSAIKITVAEWLTPLGRSIEATGIEPDEIIELTQEDANEENTPQRSAAINFLTQE